MVDMTTIALVFVAVLVIWNSILTFMFLRTKKQNELFFDDGSKNLRDLVTRAITDNKGIHQRAAKIETSIDQISSIIRNSYQRFAMVRYNPFSDTGGDQSFSLALLDLNNNGVVITSIHGREINRIYAKQVDNGVSKHNLSAEEEEAIKGAMNEKK
jgi:predicted phosphohydrolase